MLFLVLVADFFVLVLVFVNEIVIFSFLVIFVFVFVNENHTDAWSPHTRCNIEKIESVQRRAVLNDWAWPGAQIPAPTQPHAYTKGSSSSMLQYLGWNSLENRRTQSGLVMMYKIVHGLVAIPATPYLLPVLHDTRGHSSKFLVPSARVNAYRFSYFPVTIMSWNSLSAHVVRSPSVQSFKARLTKLDQAPTSSTQYRV